jgi:hypothetical protein
MISFMISVVPPKIGITGLGSFDSRVGRESLPFTESSCRSHGDLAGDQVAVQGSPRQVSHRKASLLCWNAVSHSSTQAVITPR